MINSTAKYNNRTTGRQRGRQKNHIIFQVSFLISKCSKSTFNISWQYAAIINRTSFFRRILCDKRHHFSYFINVNFFKVPEIMPAIGGIWTNLAWLQSVWLYLLDHITSWPINAYTNAASPNNVNCTRAGLFVTYLYKPLHGQLITSHMNTQ